MEKKYKCDLDLRAGRVLPTTIGTATITPQALSITAQPSSIALNPTAVTVNDEVSNKATRKPIEPEPQRPTTSERQTREGSGTFPDKKVEVPATEPLQKGTNHPHLVMFTTTFTTSQKMGSDRDQCFLSLSPSLTRD